jgi:hypothetical protein
VKRRYAKDSVRVLGGGAGAGGGDAEDSMAKNRRCEPAWVELVTEWLEQADAAAAKKRLERGALSKDDITNNSALQIGLSVYTIKTRYWPKHSCKTGPFEVYRPPTSTVDLVRLRRRPAPVAGQASQSSSEAL